MTCDASLHACERDNNAVSHLVLDAAQQKKKKKESAKTWVNRNTCFDPSVKSKKNPKRNFCQMMLEIRITTRQGRSNMREVRNAQEQKKCVCFVLFRHTASFRHCPPEPVDEDLKNKEWQASGAGNMQIKKAKENERHSESTVCNKRDKKKKRSNERKVRRNPRLWHVESN